MSLRLALFDLDGTLIDSIEDITEALNYAIEPYGLEPVRSDETTRMVGEGAQKLIEGLIRTRGARLDVDLLVKRTFEYYSTHLTEHTTVYTGVHETLGKMDFVRKGVVSNKFAALTTAILKDLELAAHFELVMGSDTLPERKPSPVPILHALRNFQVSSGEAVMIGDSEIDIRAGRAAGIWTVAVTYGYGRSGFEKEADFVIDSMTDLEGVLERIG